MPILPITIQESENILSGTSLTSCKTKIMFTGTIKLFLSQDKTVWTEVASGTLVSGDYNTTVFSSSSTSLYWRVVGINGAKITSTGTTVPGIYIEKLS